MAFYSYSGNRLNKNPQHLLWANARNVLTSQLCVLCVSFLPVVCVCLCVLRRPCFCCLYGPYSKSCSYTGRTGSTGSVCPLSTKGKSVENPPDEKGRGGGGAGRDSDKLWYLFVRGHAAALLHKWCSLYLKRNSARKLHCFMFVTPLYHLSISQYIICNLFIVTKYELQILE